MYVESSPVKILLGGFALCGNDACLSILISCWNFDAPAALVFFVFLFVHFTNEDDLRRAAMSFTLIELGSISEK